MIAHIDADSFFASVLQRKHPRLKGKPLLALGMGGGCVIAASYEAKHKGVKTGMTLREATTLCPDAATMPSDFGETALASKQIEDVIRRSCAVIERYSIDEWFLDLTAAVGGVPFDLLLWAKDIQHAIHASTDISVSIGVAPTKILAKMAGEERKPAGVTVIERYEIEAFLNRRPAAAVPGIGRARATHARARHWETAFDIAMSDRDTVRLLFGKPGVELQRELLGEKIYPVTVKSGPPKSISRCRSFRPVRDGKLLWAHLMQHTSYCILKMRTQERACRGISVWVRDAQYRYDGLRLRLPRGFDTEEAIAPYACKLFDRLVSRSNAYTQIGFALWDLIPRGSTQFSLFAPAREILREEGVQASLDHLRKKFGRQVVVRGCQMPVFEKKEMLLDMSIIE